MNRRPILPLAQMGGHIRTKSVDLPSGCREWTGPKNRSGYGVLWFNGKKWSAHRLMFTAECGPIPDGLQIDHVCHSEDDDCSGGVTCPHRACVNPAHLEPVTAQVNSQRAAGRKTHCPRGHEYTPANTVVQSNGQSGRAGRACLTCRATRNAEVARSRALAA